MVTTNYSEWTNLFDVLQKAERLCVCGKAVGALHVVATKINSLIHLEMVVLLKLNK